MDSETENSSWMTANREPKTELGQQSPKAGMITLLRLLENNSD
jgi:hypothetical protein